MGLGIPPLRIEILLESSPLKSTTSVRRLAVEQIRAVDSARSPVPINELYIYIYSCVYLFIRICTHIRKVI